MKAGDLVAIGIAIIIGIFAIWVIYEMAVWIIDNIVLISIAVLVVLGIGGIALYQKR